MKRDSYTLAERPDLIDEQERLMAAEWPEFVIHGEGGEGWVELFESFREFQFVLLQEGEIAAMGHTIPLHLDVPVEELPQEGWDWALKKGHADKAAGSAPNCLCGLSATVVSAFRGQGLAEELLDQMKRTARAEGIDRLVVPVRPTKKADYPLIPLASYVHWTRSDGEPFDPWLRIHLRSGGRLVKVANRAMRIGGSLHEWSRWTGLDFPGSGEYIIPGGLVPLKVDVDQGHAEYVEPNVWVAYEL